MRVLLHLATLVTIFTAATSTAQSQKYQATPVQHARHVIAFFESHPRAARTEVGRRAIFKAAHVFDSAVRSLQDVKSEFPPHHALWDCIQDFEGGWHDHGSGGAHYGGLQMTWGWLGYVDGDAGNLSQADQEWAAEKAWAANNYSYGFLYGQWFEWDAADSCWDRR